MTYIVAVLVSGLAAASVAAAQDLPSALAALAAKARLERPVTAWCGAEFRPGHPGAFAVAVTAPDGGRYLAIDADGRVTELGAFKRSADLACYSRAQAEELDATIKQSETVEGHVTPRWKTTVVCGFVDDTAATCWQYSPRDRKFVPVGGWVT